MSHDSHVIIIQGVIYSETAAANYADPDTFNRSLHIIPARRLGYPEEVGKHTHTNISCVLTYALPPPSLRCPVQCVSFCHRQQPTSLGVLYQLMEGKGYIVPLGSSKVDTHPRTPHTLTRAPSHRSRRISRSVTE